MVKVGKDTVFMALGLVVGALVVFVGTMAGVLAAKGKLNRDGLSKFHRVPMVGRFFPAPPTSAPKAAASGAKAEAHEHESDAGSIEALSSGEVRRLMNETRRLRDELQAKKAALATHERRLESIEKDLGHKRSEIEVVKEAVEKGWQELRLARAELEKDKVVFRESERKNLTRMAKVYEAMPSDSAALTLKSVDQDTVVKLMFLMNNRPAGKIMAAFSPEEAGKITEKMRRMRESSGSELPNPRS